MMDAPRSARARKIKPLVTIHSGAAPQRVTHLGAEYGEPVCVLRNGTIVMRSPGSRPTYRLLTADGELLAQQQSLPSVFQVHVQALGNCANVVHYPGETTAILYRVDGTAGTINSTRIEVRSRPWRTWYAPDGRMAHLIGDERSRVEIFDSSGARLGEINYNLHISSVFPFKVWSFAFGDDALSSVATLRPTPIVMIGVTQFGGYAINPRNPPWMLIATGPDGSILRELPEATANDLMAPVAVAWSRHAKCALIVRLGGGLDTWPLQETCVRRVAQTELRGIHQEVASTKSYTGVQFSGHATIFDADFRHVAEVHDPFCSFAANCVDGLGVVLRPPHQDCNLVVHLDDYDEPVRMSARMNTPDVVFPLAEGFAVVAGLTRRRWEFWHLQPSSLLAPRKPPRELAQSAIQRG